MIKRLLVSFCLVLSVFCFVIGGQLSANYTTYADENIHRYELYFNGSAKPSSISTTGTDSNVEIKDGKSLIMEMDVISSEMDNNSDWKFMISVADHGNMKSNTPTAFVSVSQKKSHNGKWQGTGIDDIKSESDSIPAKPLNEIFMSGKSVKIEYKPFFETKKGSFTLSIKDTVSDSQYENIISVENLEKNKAPDTAGIYLSMYGQMKLQVQNYSVKLSDGTPVKHNFAFSRRANEDPDAFFEKSMDIREVNDTPLTKVAFTPAETFFGSKDGADLTGTENALIMEYDIINSNFYQTNYQAGFIITTYEGFDLGSVYSKDETFYVLGNSSYQEDQYPEHCIGAKTKTGYIKDTVMEGDFLPYKIFAYGNSVKAVYTPYVSDTEQGSFKIYTKPIMEDDSCYSLQFGISNIPKEFAPANNVRIRMFIQSPMSWLQKTKFTMHMNNYKVYTKNNPEVAISADGTHTNCEFTTFDTCKVTYQTGLNAHTKKVKWTTKGEKINIVADKIKDYRFVGWYDGTGNLLSEEENYNIVADNFIVVKPQYKKVVTITVENGTVNGQKSFVFDFGADVTILADEISPNGKGYTGWYFDEVFITSDREYKFKAKENKTFTAVFGADYYKVAFINCEANSRDPVKKLEGTYIRVYSDNPKPGQEFWYWTVNGVKGGNDKIAEVLVKENMTIEAHYKNINYSLNIDDGDIIKGKKDNYLFNDIVTIDVKNKPAPEEHMVFDGWYYKDKIINSEIKVCSDSKFTFTITSDINYYPKFKKEQILVTFNGGIINGEETSAYVDYGENAFAFVNNSVVPDKKVFSHWEMNGEMLSSEPAYELKNITEKVVINAVYKDASYNVHLVNSSDDKGKFDLNVSADSKITIEASTPLKGSRFLYWVINNQIIKGESTMEITVNTDLFVNAVFEHIAYTVKINSGVTSVEETGFYGDIMVLSPDNKAGYEFKGWYKDGQLVSEEREYEFAITDNMEFTAEFEKTETQGCKGSVGGDNIIITLSLALFIVAITLIRAKKDNN